eukprot:4096456-Pyramimonas_sp.AAC.1
MDLDWLLPYPKKCLSSGVQQTERPARRYLSLEMPRQEAQGQQDNIRQAASGVKKRATSESYRGE